MEEEIKDQVQEDTSVTEVTKEPKEKQASKEQSETTDVTTEPESKVYKDHLGRELTADQLHQEYLRSSSYITKLEKQAKEWETKSREEASKVVADNDLLKNVDPNVKEAIIQIVSPVIKEHFKQRDEDSLKRERDVAFESRIVATEKKYPGNNGLPKFDREKVLEAMRDPNNDIFDPEKKFKDMNEEMFKDVIIKEALKNKSGGPSTEDTSGGAPRKPDAKTPSTWEEAAKSAWSRLNQ